MIDFEARRLNMVESQLRTNKVTDDAVLQAFEATAREVFVPETHRGVAYVDEDLSLGGGRYLMEPMVLARLLQAASIEPGDIVLEVGSASGYAAALLARLAETVVGLESDPDFVKQADATLTGLGIDNAIFVQGEMTEGYAKQAPYNAILISGAVSEVPQAIVDQLADGGRLVTVVRGEDGVGRATLLRRDGKVTSSRALFDASTPFLSGFQKTPGFVFS